MNIPFRIKMFLYHIVFSLCIAGLSLYLIFCVWYPNPLYSILDVSYIVLMMIAIDIILGPLLTLIIANPKKKEVKQDLLIIVCVQIIALVYGLYQISHNRPVWIVYSNDAFELVQANIAVREKDEIINPLYQQDSWFFPKWVAVRLPHNVEEQKQWVEKGLTESISPSMRPVLYQPVEKSFEQISAKSFKLSSLEQGNDKVDVERVLVKYPQADAYLPLWSIGNLSTVLIDSKNKEVVAIVNLRPW